MLYNRCALALFGQSCMVVLHGRRTGGVMGFRFAAVFLICTAAAFAQGAGGTITGTVSDTTGAVIPNANIQVTNSATGVPYKIGSSTTGNYTLANLPAGTYT